MYLIVRSELVPGSKNPVQLGYPENMAPNLCFVSTESTSAYIPMNAAVLRQALLNSAKTLETIGIKVVDLNLVKAEKTPAPKKKVTPKKAVPKEEPEEVKEEIKNPEPKISKEEEGDDEWQ